jgi:hypothetical protein
VAWLSTGGCVGCGGAGVGAGWQAASRVMIRITDRIRIIVFIVHLQYY